jgi:hypothetical protein
MVKGWGLGVFVAGALAVAGCKEPSPHADGTGYGVGIPRTAFTWGDDPERGENRHLPLNTAPDAAPIESAEGAGSSARNADAGAPDAGR